MTATVTLQIGDAIQRVEVEIGSLLSDLPALEQGHLQYPCAKKGICRKCLVTVTGAVSPKTTAEQHLTGDQRLACCTRVLGDVTVSLPELSSGLQTAERDLTAQDATNACFINYGIAVDIGTTTIAVSLHDRNGHNWTKTQKNPQLRFGADVVSRMEQSLAGEKTALAEAVKLGINQLIDALCAEANVQDIQIDGAIITANTAMLHLLLEQDCAPISKAPFEAKFLAGSRLEQSLGLHISPQATVLLPHCMGAFVGADIATAMLASGMLNHAQTALLVDIGTNGEMALWHRGMLHCCSTAAGPAFEGVGIRCGMHGTTGAIEHVDVVDGALQCKVIGGGQTVGICGSGVIDAIASLLCLEVLDETGRLDEDDDRVQELDGDLFFPLDKTVGIYGKDVRAVQLAKSAICAGMRTLLHSSDVTADQLDVVYLAGGFGSFIDVKKACEIGLIPMELIDRVQVLGNAALTGAQMMLLNQDLLGRTAQMQQIAKLVDLATNPVFMDAYVDGMFFE